MPQHDWRLIPNEPEIKHRRIYGKSFLAYRTLSIPHPEGPYHFALSALAQMQCLVKDAFRISRLYLDRSVARVGQCHYQTNNIPHVKTIDDETIVKVNVGIARQLNLCIRQPPRPEPSSPIIIFLRRGIPTATQNEKSIKNLAVGANAIAVEIDYTLSKQDPYPAPIHTVLAGYDWLRSNLARSDTGHKSSKIGVCGELAGGSLATMLALTECLYTPAELERQGISALAVGNPILDWTALTNHEATRKAPCARNFRTIGGCPEDAESDSLSDDGLCNMRDTYFAKPETYFDPFASPLLFFRTPSCEIPDATVTPAEHNLLDGGLEDENPLSPPIKKRRSARRYPPMGSNLLLPWTRVEVGKDCLLKDQGMDLVEMMRKSFRRSQVESTNGGNNVGREFGIVERDGIGLWDEKHTFEIGQWFGEQLRKP